MSNRRETVVTDAPRSFQPRALVGKHLHLFLLLSIVKGRLFRKEDQQACSERSVLFETHDVRPTASLPCFDCSGAAIQCDLNAVPEFYQK